MKYCIIIPTYNLYYFLQKCIDSIFATTDMSDKEIIVISNGCVDGTKEYLNSKMLQALYFDVPLGYPRAVNEGLKIATGEYIILLNNDVELMDSSWINTLLQPFIEHENCGITGPGKWMETVGGKEWSICAFWCAMFKKELVDQIGMLDEIFSPGCGEDIDFCIRAALIGKISIGVRDDIETGYYVNFPINHFGGATFSQKHEETQARIKISKEILTERYNGK